MNTVGRVWGDHADSEIWAYKQTNVHSLIKLGRQVGTQAHHTKFWIVTANAFDSEELLGTALQHQDINWLLFKRVTVVNPWQEACCSYLGNFVDKSWQSLQGDAGLVWIQNSHLTGLVNDK